MLHFILSVPLQSIRHRLPCGSNSDLRCCRQAISDRRDSNLNERFKWTCPSSWRSRASCWRFVQKAIRAIRQLADFDRFVRTYDISAPPGHHRGKFLDSLADELREAHFGRFAPLDQTLRGGTQTLGDLFSRSTPAVTALRRAIAEKVD